MAKKLKTSKPERSDEFKEALRRFKDSEQYWRENRTNWKSDVDFALLSKQWPDKIKKDRELSGRPCLTINRMPAFIRQVVNDARLNKPSIKCHAVDSGSDIETAEILNGLIRNIEYTSDADVAYDTALESAVAGGMGFFRIDLEYSGDDTFEQDIKIARIANTLSVYPPSRTEAADSSDWNYCFVSELISEEDHKARWPDEDVANFAGDDRDDLDSLWFEEKLVRIAEYWTVTDEKSVLFMLSNGMTVSDQQYKSSKDLFDAMAVEIVGRRDVARKRVTQRLMNGYCFLGEPTEWVGKYIPIIPIYGNEVSDEGKRVFSGLVRDMRDSQMMFNFWRTASTELIALAPKSPWIGPKGAFKTDTYKWETANVENHAYLEYDGNTAPQRQPFDSAPVGAIQEALNASDDMKAISGIYDAALGARSNETSGTAINARKRESDIGTFHFIDNETRAIRHAGRVLVDLIPKVYSQARVIRVIGEDGESESVQINQKFSNPEGVEKIYDLSVGKYDVTCESGPSFNTQREEAAAQMTEFVRTVPQAGQLIGDLIAKNMDWPGADDIAERLKLMLPPQLQEKEGEVPPAIKQQMQQMQQMLQQAAQKVAQLESDKSAETRKLDIEAYGKETDRLKVTSAGMQPEQVQVLVLQTLQQLLNTPDISQQSPTNQGVMQ